jgi:hypothetical protein
MVLAKDTGDADGLQTRRGQNHWSLFCQGMAKSMYCRQRWIYVDNASQWYRCLEVIVKPHESYDILSYTQDFLFQRDLFVYNSGVV